MCSVNKHVLEERISVMEAGPNSNMPLDINRTRCKLRDSFGFNGRQLTGEYDKKKFICETKQCLVLTSTSF